MTYNTTTDRDLAAIRGQLAEIIVLLRALSEQQQTAHTRAFILLRALSEQQQPAPTTKRKTR